MESTKKENLKTLKELREEALIPVGYKNEVINFEDLLKQEAIKWVKHFKQDLIHYCTCDDCRAFHEKADARAFIEDFFNITEEDLK